MSYQGQPLSLPPYILPIEALSFSPSVSDVIQNFENGDNERKIYLNTPLYPKELNLLRKFKILQKQQKIQFSSFFEIKILRCISHCRGDIPKALKMLLEAKQWKEDMESKHSFFKSKQDCVFSSLSDNIKIILHKSIVYISGRDLSFRPLIIFNLSRFIKFGKEAAEDCVIATCFLMELVQNFMLVPGKVESIIVLIDFTGVSTSEVPVGLLEKVTKVLSIQYVGRLYRMFIYNAPSMITLVWNMIKRFLTDRQRQKILFVKTLDLIISSFPSSQLEKKYGGERGEIEDFVQSRFPHSFELNEKCQKWLDEGKGDVCQCGKVADAYRVLEDWGVIWMEKAVGLNYTKYAKEIGIEKKEEEMQIVIVEENEEEDEMFVESPRYERRWCYCCN